MAARGNLANRLYRGELGLRIVGQRKLWFSIAAGLVLIAALSFALRGFSLGIEFSGGNSFQVPASVGTLEEVEDAVREAVDDAASADASVVSTQEVGGTGGSFYEVRTSEIGAEESTRVQDLLAERFDVPAEQISANRVSASWGGQVTERALLGLVIFIALVMVYLVLRFEWRMSVAAVSSLLLNLVLTAGIYSLVGFEVTPSTIIGFLTILGFALYDVVVVFDKIQENTRGITATSTQTYTEAADLAINQTLMRSINTSMVALLPVGGLLFIGAGLLGAGTLKDLGLVLFVGMAVAFFSSIFFATPLLALLKNQEPRIQSHNRRVLARRAAGADATTGRRPGRGRVAARPASAGDEVADAQTDADEVEETEDGERRPAASPAAMAGAAPKAAARPAGKRGGGARGGRPGGAGKRPSGKRR